MMSKMKESSTYWYVFYMGNQLQIQENQHQRSIIVVTDCTVISIYPSSESFHQPAHTCDRPLCTVKRRYFDFPRDFNGRVAPLATRPHCVQSVFFVPVIIAICFVLGGRNNCAFIGINYDIKDFSPANDLYIVNPAVS